MYGLNAESFGDTVLPAIVDRPPFQPGDMVRYCMGTTPRRVVECVQMPMTGQWMCYFEPVGMSPSAACWAEVLVMVTPAEKPKNHMFVVDAGFAVAIYSANFTVGNDRGKHTDSVWLVPEPNSYLWVH